MTTEVFLSLGSNVDPEANLRLGVTELRRRYRGVQCSPVYRNKAVGFDGDDFLNLVVRCECGHDAATMSAEIEAIHRLAGRRRGEEKFSSRTLDIDILLFGDQVTDGPPLRLPREDVLRYGFVLKPLADLAPDALHPQTRRSYRDHWDEMADAADEFRRVDVDFD